MAEEQAAFRFDQVPSSHPPTMSFCAATVHIFSPLNEKIDSLVASSLAVLIVRPGSASYVESPVQDCNVRHVTSLTCHLILC